MRTSGYTFHTVFVFAVGFWLTPGDHCRALTYDFLNPAALPLDGRMRHRAALRTRFGRANQPAPRPRPLRERPPHSRRSCARRA